MKEVLFDVAIDSGYGFTKIVHGDNKRIMFPSISCVADSAETTVPYRAEIDGIAYFVGEAVYNASDYIETATEDDRFQSEVFQRMFLTGIAAALKPMPTTFIPVRVSTGLPVSHFKDHRDDPQKMVDRHAIVLNDQEILFEITEIKVIPQPLGTYLSMVNREVRDQYILIIDVGHKTTDFLLVDRDRVLSKSRSVSIGMSLIANDITEYAYSRSGKNYAPNQAHEILTKGFTNRGRKEFILDDFLQPRKDKLCQAIWNKAKEIYQDYSSLDKIVFTGGVVSTLADSIKTIGKADGMGSFFTVPDPQWANVTGYKKLLEGLPK